MGQSSSSSDDESDDEQTLISEHNGTLILSSYDDVLGSIKAAENSKTLTTLSLDFVRMKNVDWFPTYDAMSKIENLTTLKMLHCGINDNDAREIATRLPNLTTFVSGSNPIGYAGAKEIAHNMRKLVSLTISFTSFGSESAVVLSTLPNLRTLSLCDSRIDDDGATKIATNAPNLTTLDLSRNKIGRVGAIALSKMKNLKTLELHYNTIGNEGAIALSSMPNLETLDLSLNYIGSDGAIALSTKFPKLKTLDLHDNLIGDGGAAALSTLSNLEMLDLSNNRIGDAGAREIVMNAPKMTKLISLVLITNVGITDWAPLISAFANHPTWFYFVTDGRSNNDVVIRIQDEKRLREFFDSSRVTGFNMTRKNRDRLTNVNGPIKKKLFELIS